MILDLPQVGPVKFDDNLTQEQLDYQLDAIGKKYGVEFPKAEMGYGEMAKKALVRGGKELGVTFGDIIPAMGAKALGFDEYAKKQMGEAAESQADINKYYGAQYKNLEDVKGPSDYLGFGLETFLENVPNIATSLIPGVGAEAIAGRMALGSVAKSLTAQAVEKGLAGDAAASFITQGMAKAVPQITRTEGIAQNAGIFLGSYAQNAPEVFQNIYEKTGEMAPGAAMLWGSAAAALDSVLPSQIAKSLTGPVKIGIVEKILEKSGMDKGLLRSITSNVIKDAGYEGITEGAQEAISESAEKFIGNNPQIFDSSDWKRIIESSVRGAIAGGPFGAVTGTSEAARRKAQYDAAIAKREGRLQTAQETADLKAAAAEAGVSIEEYQKAQGELPGLETGPYTALYDAEAIKKQGIADTKAAKELAKLAPKELKGVQTELFDESGLPTKQAETAKTKGDKILANQARDAQKRLKSFLKSKQGELTLLETPPTLAQAGEPNLFNQPEPKVFKKTAALTPQEVPTVVGDETFKALGIGRTATIIKNKLIEGKDISNPVEAAEVKRILEAYAGATTSSKARANVETYLQRPEFQATVQETPNEPRTGPIPGERESSLPSAGETVSTEIPAEGISQPISRGVGVSGQSIAPVNAGEELFSSALGTKETQDLAKTEAATQPILTRQERKIKHNDLRTGLTLNDKISAAAEKEGLLPDEVTIEPKDIKESHDILRLPFLFNEAFFLQDSINNPQNTPQGQAQQAREQAQLQTVKDAIAKSGPEVTQIFNNLQAGNHADKSAGISLLNKFGNDTFDKMLTTKVAEAKARLDNDKKEAALRKEQEAQVRALGAAREASPEARKEQRQEDILEEDVDYVQYGLEGLPKNIEEAVANDKFQEFISNLASTETDPTVKSILEKIEKMRLKTKTKVGKPTRKGGETFAENDAGVYDPATDTITLDPKLGLTRHTATHELVHAAISHVLRNPDHPLTKQLTAIYEGVYNQLGSTYGAQDIQEFAAELVGNPEFRAALKGIKAPKGGNMLQRIIQHIAEFFGFRKGSSAYEAGIKTINDILDISSTVPRSTGEQMFNVISDVNKAMPVLTKNLSESVKNTFANTKDAGALTLALGIMRLDHINKIWGKQLPGIQKLIDALEMRKGYQEAGIKRVQTNYSHFLKLAKTKYKEVKRMENMAYDARLAGVDPANPNFKTTTSTVAQYNRLRGVYNSLDSDVRDMYDTIRADYKKAFDDYKAFLLNSTDSPTLKQKIKAQFETNSNVVAYIPFLRRGDYWVRYADPVTGEEAASAFESTRERQQFIDSQLKGKDHTKYQNLENITFDPRSIPSHSFIAQIMKGLAVKDQVTGKMIPASQEQMNNVYQAYLTLFPAQSIVKNFMRSKNMLGMERDIVRGYGDTMLKWSRKLADTMYTPEVDESLRAIKTEADNLKDDSIYPVVRHIEGQSKFYHDPTYGKFTQFATTLSYFEYIAGNISSALINLSALPMLVWPILGGRFGFANTTSAMLNAHKTATGWVFKGNNKVSKYDSLYKYLQEHGQLEHTMARELLEGRRRSTEYYTGLKAKVMGGISAPFSATEKYNRAVTAIAAYDLAKANGDSEEKALRLALDTVKDVHTSGMAETAPRWMQHPLGRVFFTFKSFTWNSAFIIARAFHQAFKGEDAKVRRAAREQLVGMLFMTGMFAGVKGMPFMGVAETVGQMLHALFGDDDEPYDLKNDLRAFFGELVYKGPVNWLTNLEVSNRVGIAQDLIWRDDPRADSGFILGAMQRAFGPAGSYAGSVENAVKMFNEGHTERAIEAVMPSFIRNGMKSLRFLSEGALTLKGDPVDEDVGAYNSLMQGFGFSPASLSSKYEVTSAAKTYEKKVAEQRQSLLNKYSMAKQGGDADLMMEAREDMASFNSKHPSQKITSTTLQKSESARKAAEKNTINGVTFNKKLLPELKTKFFEE